MVILALIPLFEIVDLKEPLNVYSGLSSGKDSKGCDMLGTQVAVVLGTNLGPVTVVLVLPVGLEFNIGPVVVPLVTGIAKETLNITVSFQMQDRNLSPANEI